MGSATAYLNPSSEDRVSDYIAHSHWETQILLSSLVVATELELRNKRGASSSNSSTGAAQARTKSPHEA
ncbi:hypothetical protein SEPCBS57363_006336, partial [Sporothrix epigloea]